MPRQIGRYPNSMALGSLCDRLKWNQFVSSETGLFRVRIATGKPLDSGHTKRRTLAISRRAKARTRKYAPAANSSTSCRRPGLAVTRAPMTSSGRVLRKSVPERHPRRELNGSAALPTSSEARQGLGGVLRGRPLAGWMWMFSGGFMMMTATAKKFGTHCQPLRCRL